MKTNTVNDKLFRRFLAATSPAPIGLEIVRADGVRLWDKDGKEYYDLIAGISVANVGHNHPEILGAIREQMDKHLHLMVYGEYIQAPQVLLAERLASLLPASLSSVFFVNSGSEAIEGAVKLAKRHTGRFETASLNNAYHGSTMGSLSLMGAEYYSQGYRPLVPGNVFLRANNLEDITLIDHQTACLVVEPVMGEAGVVPLENEYLWALRRRCDETGTLLIFDEIQTGMGRTGKMFALEHSRVVPDILCLAKALGGGLPLGAFIASPEIMRSIASDPVLGHITTFGGHPLSCAAALASLNIIESEGLCERAITISDLITYTLQDCSRIHSIRRSGLLMALELNDSKLLFASLDRMRQKGVLSDWFLFCDTAIRVAPPLTIKEEEIIHACEIIRTCLNEI
jgi:acetylornithine/succinyldiaminopimelate/putrescine aminotransferase